MGFGISTDFNSESPSFFLALIYLPCEIIQQLPIKWAPAREITDHENGRQVGSPTEPRSKARI